MNAKSNAESILVVDDTPANLQLLTMMLRERGYRVRPVSNGEMALRAVEAQAPDLVLLDITMPGLNGYEVCRRLKADERWRDIPVIFISALSDTDIKVRAFRAGGVDYVSKPFQFEEVDARVRAHLELRRQQRRLQESYARLQEEERMRDSLTHMIAHDMRSPLLALQISLEMLRNDLPDPALSGGLLMTTAQRSVAQLVEMISQMLDVSQMEEGKLELHRARADLVAVIREVITALQPLAGSRCVAVKAPESVELVCDRDLIRRVVANLIGNALKFTPGSGRIEILVAQEPSAAKVEVRDTGPGIAPEFHQRIFQKFGQVGAGPNRVGSGLGLTFAKLAVEAHGGAIGLESTVGKGSTFWITLPQEQTEAEAAAATGGTHPG